MSKLAAAHSDIGQQVLLETARLHSGDPTNVELWREFLPACLAEIEVIYKRLGVTFDHTLGESFYQDRLRGVVKDLSEKGLAQESDGAICVFLDGYDVPMIVQKQDGAFLIRDDRPGHDSVPHERVAAGRDSVRRRSSAVAPFRAAFRGGAASGAIETSSCSTSRSAPCWAKMAGRSKRAAAHRLVLSGLLDEAVERAYAIVSQNDDSRPEPLLSEEERRQVAERIGIGAIKYADLAHNRTSDYVFSYDKMLAMTGNTAAYMQYSYARVRSIFAKAGVSQSEIRNPKVRSNPTILLTTPQERALGHRAAAIRRNARPRRRRLSAESSHGVSV